MILTSVEILLLKACIELLIKMGVDVASIIKQSKIEDKETWLADIDAAYARLRDPANPL